MLPSGFMLPVSQISNSNDVQQLILDPSYLRDTLSQVIPNFEISSDTINLGKSMDDCLMNMDDESKANLSALLFAQVFRIIFN